MNHYSKKIIGLALMLIIVLNGHSQLSNSFKDIFTIQLEDMAPFYEDDVVKGYYMFYEMDKIDKKNQSFLIKILDENVREVFSRVITRPKGYALSRVRFNGTAILFLFMDPKDQKIELMTMDNKGNVLGKRIIENVKEWNESYVWEIKMWRSAMRNKKNVKPNSQFLNGDSYSKRKMYGSIVPVKGRGFLINKQIIKNKKSLYELEYLPNELGESKGWKNSPNAKTSTHASTSIWETVGDYAILKVHKYKHEGFYIKVININSGENVFEKKIVDKRYRIDLKNVFFDEEKKEILVIGRYYSKEKNALLSNKTYSSLGLGLFGVRLSLSGEIIFKNFVQWQEKLGDHIAIDKKGRLKDVSMSLSIEEVIYINNRYYFIGSIGGGQNLPMGTVTNSRTPTGSDFYIIEVNSDFSIDKIHSWDWGRTKVRYSEGDNSENNVTIDKSIKDYRYRFSLESKDKKSFYTTFLALEKGKGKKMKPILWSISGTGEEFVEDKISLETEASQINIMIAKPGYILLVEYFEKEKKIDLRLEKFNF